MKDKLIHALAHLASREFQLAYVVNGTAARYFLAVELLEDVDGIISRARRPENASTFNNAQWAALNDLDTHMNARSGEALADREDFNEHLLNGAIWNELRARAALALAALGGSLEDFDWEDD